MFIIGIRDILSIFNFKYFQYLSIITLKILTLVMIMIVNVVVETKYKTKWSKAFVVHFSEKCRL